MEELINEVKYSIYDIDKSSSIDSLYNFLRESIPKFKDFKMSPEDSKLISDIGDSNIYSYIIAEKIINNAGKIISNNKESRFGNLFVGLEEISDGFNQKYGK